MNANTRVRMRTTRPMAGLGFAVGCVLALMGLVIAQAAPGFGLALAAAGLATAGYHGSHFFARRGGPVAAERGDDRAERAEGPARTLRAPDGLRPDGLPSRG